MDGSGESCILLRAFVISGRSSTTAISQSVATSPSAGAGASAAGYSPEITVASIPTEPGDNFERKMEGLPL